MAGTSTSSAPHSRSMSFFSWLCVFGDHDQRAIAARVGDQRKADAGVAGGALDHQPARLEFAALLGLQDHLPAGRSFTDWPGFMNSALPRMVQPVAADARSSLISGVLPMASTMPSRICMVITAFSARFRDRSGHVLATRPRNSWKNASVR